MRFEVLGPLQVRDSQESIDVGPPQHRAVLAALVMDAGRVVDADVLLDRVWGQDGGAGATASLHSCISRLRKRLGGSLILTQAPGYLLAVARPDVDATHFADLVSAARRATAEGDAVSARALVTQALELWRGGPYGGVRADFVAREVARLQEQRLAATELAAELDLALGREADLAGWLPDVVAAHPLREGPRGTLMTALYRLGRQADALALYQEARYRLAEDLGVDPGPDLQRLHTLVLRQDPVLDSPAPVAVRPTSPTPPTAPADPTPPDVLVGRDDELARGLGALARGARGAPAVVVVHGEAGIGKTRLVEELLRRNDDESDGDVVWGRCFDHVGTAAFGPWAQALGALTELRDADEVARALAGRGSQAAVLLPPDLVPGAHPPPEASAPDTARARLYDAVTAFLETLAAQRPVTVVLEDLHWADPESAELTEYVAATARTGALTLLMTVRNPTEDGGTRGDALLGALARRPGTERIGLAGLDTADVRRFAAGRLGQELDQAAAERLRSRTDGNPFYIAELVRLLGEERQRSGRATGGVPTTVRAVIERRLRHLEPATRELLSAASVIGRSFDVRILGDVAGRTPLQLTDALDPAAAAGILLPDAEVPGRWSFAHALVQDTLAAGTGPMRRAALHTQVAESLERRHPGDPGEIAAELAHHHAAAGVVGDPVAAVRFTLLAAEAAQARLAFDEAQRHLERAVGLVAAIPGTEAEVLELQARVQLGSLLTLRYGYNASEVAQQRERARELAVRTGSTEALLSALWGTWGVALVSGDFPTADAVAAQLGEAAARTRDPMPALGHHHAAGQVRYHQGRLAEALHHLRQAADLADRHGDLVKLEIFLQHPAVTSRAWSAKVLALMGRIEESDALAAEAAAHSARLGDPYTDTYLDVLEGWRAVFLDRPEQALHHGEHGSDVAERHGFGQLVAFLLPPRGWARARHGRSEEGVADVRLGIDIFSSLPAGHMFGHLMAAALSDALRLDGRPEQARAAAEAGIAEGERLGERFFLAGLHLRRAALTRVLGGPQREIRADLEQAVSVATEQGAGLFLARAAAFADG